MKLISKVLAARQIVHDIASWLTIIPLLAAFANNYFLDDQNHDYDYEKKTNITRLVTIEK